MTTASDTLRPPDTAGDVHKTPGAHPANEAIRTESIE